MEHVETLNQSRQVFGPQVTTTVPPDGLLQAVPRMKTKKILFKGMNARVFWVPAQFKVVTSILQHDHLMILSQGSVLVESNDKKVKYQAPAWFTVPENISTIIRTLETSIWYTLYAEPDIRSSSDLISDYDLSNS